MVRKAYPSSARSAVFLHAAAYMAKAKKRAPQKSNQKPESRKAEAKPTVSGPARPSVKIRSISTSPTFCTANIVPGVDFSNDPLLAGRIHSYVDTQISRLGGPNFRCRRK